MSKDLTANFTANTAGFTAGMQKIKAELTELNRKLDENKDNITSTNRQIKAMVKELEELRKASNPTKEQTARMKELEISIAQAKVKVSELKADQQLLKTSMSQTTKETQKQSDRMKDLQSKLGALKSYIGGFIAAYGGAKLLDALFGTNAQMEQHITSFEVMLGSAAKAEALVEKMQSFAAKTPLAMSDIVANGSLLLNYGVDEDKLIDTMTKLGDLAAGNADKLNRITLAYGQMLAKGKVTGEELLQLTEAGVPLQAALADSIGVSGAELSDMVSKGKVGINELNAAITNLTTGNGKFAGMMEKQAQTMQGQLSTLQDNLSNFFRQMGEGAFGEIKDVISDINNTIEQWSQDGTLDEWGENIGELLRIVVVVLKNIITFGVEAKDVIGALLITILSFKSAISFGNIVSVLSAKVNDFKNSLYSANVAKKAFDATGAKNTGVLKFSGYLTTLITLLTVMTTLCNNAGEKAEKLLDTVSETVQKAEDSANLSSTLQNIIQAYKESIDTVNSAAEKTAKLKDLQSQLNSVYGDSVTAIDLVNGKYEENIALLQQMSASQKTEAKEAAQLALNELKKVEEALPPAENLRVSHDTIMNGSSLGVEGIKNGDIDNPNVTIATKSEGLGVGRLYGPLVDVVQIEGDTFAERAQAYSDYVAYLEKIGEQESEEYSYAVKKKHEYTEHAETIAQYEDMLTDILNGNTKAQNDNTQATEKSTSALQSSTEATEDLTDTTSALLSELDSVAAAFAEFTENGEISYNTMLKLIDAGYAQCLSLDNETGKIRLNTEAYKELAKAKLAAQITDINAQVAEAEQLSAKLKRAQQQGNTSDIMYYSRLLAESGGVDAGLVLQRDTLQYMYDNFDKFSLNGSFTSTKSSSSSLETTSKDSSYEDYKTEADKKIELINRELKAKQKLRDETIKAIDDEIAARKRLNEDNDLEEQINKVKAQLKYSQLDEFSRWELENRLGELYDQKSEIDWQRGMEDRKAQANKEYEAEQEAANAKIDSINRSLDTINQILSGMERGASNLQSVINNNSVTKNNSVNVNVANSALTLAQITKAVTDALMDNIVVK